MQVLIDIESEDLFFVVNKPPEGERLPFLVPANK